MAVRARTPGLRYESSGAAFNPVAEVILGQPEAPLALSALRRFLAAVGQAGAENRGSALQARLFADDLALKVKRTECFNRCSKFHALCSMQRILHWTRPSSGPNSPTTAEILCSRREQQTSGLFVCLFVYVP